MRRIHERVRALPDDDLVTVNEPQFVATFTEQVTQPPPVIEFARKSHRYLEPEAQRGKTQQRMIEYTLPVSGSASLLTIEPSSVEFISVEFISVGRTPKLVAHQHQGQETITFQVPEVDDIDQVVQEVKAILRHLEVNSARLATELQHIHAGIASEIHSAITHERERRAEERRRRDDLEERLP